MFKQIQSTNQNQTHNIHKKKTIAQMENQTIENHSRFFQPFWLFCLSYSSWSLFSILHMNKSINIYLLLKTTIFRQAILYENCISMVKVVHAKQKMQLKEVTLEQGIKVCRQIPYQSHFTIQRFQDMTTSIDL